MNIKRDDIDNRKVNFSNVGSGRRLPPVHRGEILRAAVLDDSIDGADGRWPAGPAGYQYGNGVLFPVRGAILKYGCINVRPAMQRPCADTVAV
jgi:hypothetical protein